MITEALKNRDVVVVIVVAVVLYLLLRRHLNADLKRWI